MCSIQQHTLSKKSLISTILHNIQVWHILHPVFTVIMDFNLCYKMYEDVYTLLDTILLQDVELYRII